MFQGMDFSKFHHDGSKYLDLNANNWKNWKKPVLDDFDVDVDGKIIEFEGNPELKPPNCKLQLTPEHSYEYMRCSLSPQYFFLNYAKIKSSKTGRLEYPEIRDYQIRYFNHLVNHKKTCALMPRQSGKTTIVGSYIVHYMIFNPDRTVLVVAQQKDTALEHLQERIQPIVCGLPKWMSPGLLQYAKTSMKFENGSRVVVRATSGKAAAGLSINMLYVDEYALVDTTKATDFARAVLPTISGQAGSEVHVTSTPRGMNHFYKMYKGKNQFVGFGHDQKDPERVITWQEVPRYIEDEKTGKKIKLDPEEFKKSEMPNVGGERGWNQEYECKFLGSSNTLISGTKLEQLSPIDPIETIKVLSCDFKIYEKPIEGCIYVCGVDTSSGLQTDCNAINIFNVSRYPFEQVASMRSDSVRWRTMPAILNEIGRYYNDCMMVIENNGLGEAVSEMLWEDHTYYNIFSWHPSKGTRNLDKFGIHTTPKVKIKACTALKDLIEKDKLIVKDNDLIEELFIFIQRNNSWAAEEGQGNYDDSVMSSVMAALFISLDEFDMYLKSPTNFVKDVLGDELNAVNRSVDVMFKFSDGYEYPKDLSSIVRKTLRDSHGPIRTRQKIQLGDKKFGYERDASWLF